VSRSGLELGLESGPRVVGRLGSGVCVSASFQSFALTAEANVLGGEGNCPGRPAGEMSGEGDMSEGTCPGGMC